MGFSFQFSSLYPAPFIELYVFKPIQISCLNSRAVLVLPTRHIKVWVSFELFGALYMYMSVSRLKIVMWHFHAGTNILVAQISRDLSFMGDQISHGPYFLGTRQLRGPNEIKDHFSDSLLSLWEHFYLCLCPKERILTNCGIAQGNKKKMYSFLLHSLETSRIP